MLYCSWCQWFSCVVFVVLCLEWWLRCLEWWLRCLLCDSPGCGNCSSMARFLAMVVLVVEAVIGVSLALLWLLLQGLW